MLRTRALSQLLVPAFLLMYHLSFYSFGLAAPLFEVPSIVEGPSSWLRFEQLRQDAAPDKLWTTAAAYTTHKEAQPSADPCLCAVNVRDSVSARLALEEKVNPEKRTCACNTARAYQPSHLLSTLSIIAKTSQPTIKPHDDCDQPICLPDSRSVRLDDCISIQKVPQLLCGPLLLKSSSYAPTSVKQTRRFVAASGRTMHHCTATRPTVLHECDPLRH